MSYWKYIVLGIFIVCIGIVGATFLVTYEQYNQMLNNISIAEERNTVENKWLNESSVLPQHDRESILQGDSNPQPKYQSRPFLDNKPLHNKKSAKKTSQIEPMEPFILLLYGIDKREHIQDRGRPDTLMLALIHPKLARVNLISIPRDAYVPIPQHGKHKLNHSFSKGGVDLTIKTIETWLDIDLKGYFSIDFEGFEKLVDLVGGIEIEVDRDMAYDDPEDGTSIRLNQGLQVLNGKQALDFVRFRHSNDGKTDSDYKRMERQQKVLKTIGGEMVSIHYMMKMFAMMRVLEEHLKTTLKPAELDTLIRLVPQLDMNNFVTTSMTGEGKYEDGLWFEVISNQEKSRIQTLIQDFLETK